MSENIMHYKGHTHVDNSCFSVDDMVVMCNNESMREIRVITQDGTIYSMSVGNGERPDRNTLRSTYKKYEQEAQAKYPILIDSESWTTDAAEKMAARFNWNITKE